MEPPRIYADFHGEQSSPRDPARTAVPLDTFGTVKDLSNVGVRLRDGARLTIYADSDENEDLEADAVAFYARERGLWFAELCDGRIRYVPRPEQKTQGLFLCVQCRSALPVAKYGRPEVEACPRCGSPAFAAIEPPQRAG